MQRMLSMMKPFPHMALEWFDIRFDPPYKSDHQHSMSLQVWLFHTKIVSTVASVYHVNDQPIKRFSN